jgi:hypothetical protein
VLVGPGAAARPHRAHRIQLLPEPPNADTVDEPSARESPGDRLVTVFSILLNFCILPMIATLCDGWQPDDFKDLL